jgi:hypothetical protein
VLTVIPYNPDDHLVLRPPRVRYAQIDAQLKNKIARFLACYHPSATVRQFQHRIPDNLCQWGKLRIKAGGDLIRTAATEKSALRRVRDASYIRVCHFLSAGAKH